MSAILNRFDQSDQPRKCLLSLLAVASESLRSSGSSALLGPSAGHGIGPTVSERIKHSADIYSFLFAQRG